MSQDKASKIHPNGSGPEQQPDPEVVARAKRRTFTAAYKQRILAEAERCDESGQVGALLRREGLYASHLTTWRRQQATGQLTGLSPKRRGRQKDEQAAELAALRQENERLRAQLTQAEFIITAQKKLAQALEQTLSRSEDGRS